MTESERVHGHRCRRTEIGDDRRRRRGSGARLGIAGRCACVVAALIASLTGCNDRPSRRIVHVRVADQLYGAGAPLRGSTIRYPTRSRADETRVVLRGSSAGESAGNAPIAFEIDVPEGAVMDFGYALGEVEAGAGVEFSVTASADGKVTEVLRTQLESGRGNAARAPEGWHDVRADLGAMSGRVRFEFLAISDRSSALPGTDGVPPCGFFSEPVVTRPSDRESPPNVILISLDTLRADRLGIYGYDKKTSPNIDRIFGAGGVVVERMYSNAVNTLNGHAAMLTGLRPKTVLTKANVGKLASWGTTLAEEFRARGYRTGAFTEDAWVTAGFGFRRGFERYGEERSPLGLNDTSGHSRQIFASGLQWLEAQGEQPTLLFLHTYEVHYPYATRGEITPEDSSARAVDSARYDAEIRYLDEGLGAFLAALEQRGLLGNTIVAVTADHGEEFGEHGRRYHGNNLHDEVLHVPALFLAPGRLPAGLRRAGPVELVDLMPTLLELAGIGAPPDLDGRSFAAHLREGSVAEPRVIYHEADTKMVVTYGAPDTEWLPPSYAMTKWPHRLIRIRTGDGQRYELFDLVADPGETDNLYEEMKDRFAGEREQLDRYEEMSAGRRQALTRRVDGAGTAAEPEPEDVDPKVSEKLRALGYAQ